MYLTSFLPMLRVLNRENLIFFRRFPSLTFSCLVTANELPGDDDNDLGEWPWIQRTHEDKRSNLKIGHRNANSWDTVTRVMLPTKTRIQRRVYLAFGVLLSSYEFSGPNEWADSPVLLSIHTRLQGEGIARIDNGKSVLSSSPPGESNDSIIKYNHHSSRRWVYCQCNFRRFCRRRRSANSG